VSLPLPDPVDLEDLLEPFASRGVDLRLERLRAALADGGHPERRFPAVQVAGTNGKGSICSFLHAILRAAGLRCGTYRSPHLLSWCERLQIDDGWITPAQLRHDLQRWRPIGERHALTPFELLTAAAFDRLAVSGVELAVLEVGLGGRLDATTAHPERPVIGFASIGLDHREHLGDTLAAIAREKAGIYRSGRPAICVDPEPPATLLEHAADIGAELFCIGREFRLLRQERQWSFEGAGLRLSGLPMPALVGEHQLQNAAGVIAALGSLRERLPVSAGAIREGLMNVSLAGRFQVLPGRPMVILDVAHNAHAARILARNLRAIPPTGRTHAVFSILADKDAAATVAELGDLIDVWWVAGLGGPRGRRAEDLAPEVARVVSGRVEMARDPVEAWLRVREALGDDDKVVVFGSFLTVAEVLAEVRGA